MVEEVAARGDAGAQVRSTMCVCVCVYSFCQIVNIELLCGDGGRLALVWFLATLPHSSILTTSTTIWFCRFASTQCLTWQAACALRMPATRMPSLRWWRRRACTAVCCSALAEMVL